MFRVQFKFKNNMEIIKKLILAVAVFVMIFYLQTTIAWIQTLNLKLEKSTKSIKKSWFYNFEGFVFTKGVFIIQTECIFLRIKTTEPYQLQVKSNQFVDIKMPLLALIGFYTPWSS